MEKLRMCRICLVEDVRMYVVVNRNLHELYEKLTDIPFVTEDSRPIFACFFCYAKLKQCYRLLRKCLEAEELFAQMINEDYKPNSLINQDHLEFSSGFVTSPIVHISIVDACQRESIAIKEELPAVCEGLEDIIDPMEEHQSEEPELENLHNSCLDEADIYTNHSESDLEDDVPLMEFKIEVEEEQEVSKTKRRFIGATVAEKPKLNTRKIKQEESITEEPTKKEKSDSKVIRTTEKRTSEPDTCFKEPDKCDQRNFNRVKKIIQHTRTKIGEKPLCDVCTFSVKGSLTKHYCIYNQTYLFGGKPYKCDVCQRSFKRKCHLTKHIRIHTGEKPHKCDVCPSSFTDSGDLKTHIRIHTGEKPYKCDVCQRGFNQKSNLTKHHRIHTGRKPYKCNVCQRSFTEKSNLTKHIRLHTG